VRADVIAAWKKDKGQELAAQAAADAVKRLAGGESWDSVAKSLGLNPEAPKFVSRSDQAAPREVTREAFEEQKPDGKPVYTSVPLMGGDAAVVALSAVREDPGDTKLQDAMFKRQFAQQSSMGESAAYAAAARADAKVSVNLQALD
jgi:hypothetical protein